MNLTVGKLIFGSSIGFCVLISCSHFKAIDFRKPAQTVIVSDMTYFQNSQSAWSNTVLENLNYAFTAGDKCSFLVDSLAQELLKIDVSQMSLQWVENVGKNYLKNSANIKFQVNGRMSEISFDCRTNVSSFFTKLRDLDDYVGERVYKVKSLHGEELKFDKEPVPILESEKYNKYFLNPKIEKFKFEPGDVIITRGISFISAAIAQSTKSPSKFSHGVFVHVNESGAAQTIESYINSGVKYYSIEDALKNENARIMIFRAKDKNLSKRADQIMSKKVDTMLKKNGKISYDYESDYADHEKMTCIEIPYAAYKLASDQRIILPQVQSEMRLTKTDIISGLNIKPGKIFSPFNIETDDRFELVLDWTDYRLTQDQRNKDTLLSAMFDLIEGQDYVLQENLDSIGARWIWKSRAIPVIWHMLGGIGKLNELPADLPMQQILISAKLKKVANIILSDLRKWQSTDLTKIYTSEEISNWIKAYILNDREKYIAGQRADLHIYFRPLSLQKNQSDRYPTSTALTCDLSTDRCSGKPLDEAQTAKTLFLSDIVTDKLSQIEAEEKLKGRDFKIALISRMGSDLSRFQPLIDTDSSGQKMTVQQIADRLMSESKSTNESSENFQNLDRISYLAMRSQFDRTKKLKYSHVGIAVKNLIVKDKNGEQLTGPATGKWAIVHLLYSCEDSNQSYVYKGTVANFFYDHMFDYGSQVMVPHQDLQNNIDQIITKDLLGNNWVEKQYNALALTNDLNQQNSNQWVMEVIAAGMYPAGQIKNRKQAQDVLNSTNYSATKVTPTGLYTALTVPVVGKIVSSMMPTVCLERQPTIKKYGIAEIISALSVEEYLEKNKRLNLSYEVGLTNDDKKELDQLLGKPKNTKTNFETN